jgi:hypothetical protein
MKPASRMPDPGALILLRLIDGRFGAARVLRAPTQDEQKCFQVPVVLIAVTPWVGEGPADLGAPGLRRTLTLTNEFDPPEPCVAWVGAPPEGFSAIGALSPTEDDVRYEHPPRARGQLSGSAWPG